MSASKTTEKRKKKATPTPLREASRGKFLREISVARRFPFFAFNYFVISYLLRLKNIFAAADFFYGPRAHLSHSSHLEAFAIIERKKLLCDRFMMCLFDFTLEPNGLKTGFHSRLTR